MALRFSLDKFLKDNGITAYRLAKETEGLVARGSVFAMARGDGVKRIDLANLEHLMAAIEAVTGKHVTIGELFTGTPEQVKPRSSSAGVPYTNDRITNEILDEQPDTVERFLRHKASKELEHE